MLWIFADTLTRSQQQKAMGSGIRTDGFRPTGDAGVRCPTDVSRHPNFHRRATLEWNRPHNTATNMDQLPRPIIGTNHQLCTILTIYSINRALV